MKPKLVRVAAGRVRARGARQVVHKHSKQTAALLVFGAAAAAGEVEVKRTRVASIGWQIGFEEFSSPPAMWWWWNRNMDRSRCDFTGF